MCVAVREVQAGDICAVTGIQDVGVSGLGFKLSKSHLEV
jgi:hypothetical protein